MRCSYLEVCLCIVAAWCVCSCSGALATTYVIDDFSATSSNVSPVGAAQWPIAVSDVFAPPVTGVELAVTGAIGGARGHYIDHASAFLPTDSAIYTINTTGGNSFLDYQSTANGSAQIDLEYGSVQQVAGTYSPLSIPYNAGDFTLSFRSLSIPAGKQILGFAAAWGKDSSGQEQSQGNFLFSIPPGSQQTFTIPLSPAL